MSETEPSPESADEGDGVIDELHRLLDEFRASPAPPPVLSDEELIAEIHERATRDPLSTPPSPSPQDGQ